MKHSSAKLIYIILSIFVVLLTAAALYFTFTSDELPDKILYPVLFFAAIVLICVFFPRGLMKSLQKQQETNKLLSEDTENIFSFETSEFTVETSRNGEKTGYNKFSYPQIFKVDETPDYFFVTCLRHRHT